MIDGNSTRVEVFDLGAERVIFSSVPMMYDRNLRRHFPEVEFRLSASGRSLASHGVVVEGVDSSKQLLVARGSMLRLVEQADLVAQEEPWDRLWPRGRLDRWRTVAFRDLDTCNLRVRCWTADAAVLDHTNLDGTLGVADDGAVCRSA
jgi:hypothetical protein